MNTFMQSFAAQMVPFVNKNELGSKKHFDLKTSDRGRDTDHCQAVVKFGVLAYTKHRKGFEALAAEYGYSLHQFMMAATGRPFENRKSGKKAGGQNLANEVATQLLTDLSKLVKRKRPDCQYNGCQVDLVAAERARIQAAIKEDAPKQQVTDKPKVEEDKPRVRPMPQQKKTA